MKNKRMLSFLTAVSLAALSLSACSGNTGGKNGAKGELNENSQFPIVNEPVTLRVMAPEDYSELYIFKEYEKMTNIKIDWVLGDSAEVINLTFASGDLPDIYFKCNLSANRQIRYGSSGQLLNLMENNRLEKYAPNFWKFMNEYPDVKASQTFPDGSIYSIPAACDGPATRIAGKVFVNNEWLTNIGRATPQTADEFYTLLKDFKTKDPNQNGQADEVPFSATQGMLYEFFSGFFGLQNRGTHNKDFDYDETTGGLRHVQTSGNYRKMVEYVKKLYSEDLIDKQYFTANMLDSAALVNQNKCGMYVFTNLGLISQDMMPKMQGIDPVAGADGKALWTAGVRSRLHSTGAFVISSKCQNPEAALRWVDYFYSDEGNLFYHYGKVGETCVKNDDGTYSFSQDILNQIKGTMTYDEVVGKISPYGGGNNPTVMKPPFFSGAECAPQALAAAEKAAGAIPDEIWPFFNFTIDEDLDYDIIMKDINGFVLQRTGEWITGKVQLNDATWTEYKTMINNMGLARAQELAEVAYARAKAVMGS